MLEYARTARFIVNSPASAACKARNTTPESECRSEERCAVLFAEPLAMPNEVSGDEIPRPGSYRRSPERLACSWLPDSKLKRSACARRLHHSSDAAEGGTLAKWLRAVDKGSAIGSASAGNLASHVARVIGDLRQRHSRCSRADRGASIIRRSGAPLLRTVCYMWGHDRKNKKGLAC